MKKISIIARLVLSCAICLPGHAFAVGSLDPSFGNGGKVTTDFPGSSKARAVVIQTDGKIVVAGESAAFLLARYNADGTLDQTFGTAGQVVTGLPQQKFGPGVNALAIQPDGKIIAVGGNSIILDGDFVVARYNPNGTLDSSFGTGGIVTTDFAGNDVAFTVTLQVDGRLVVAGGVGTGLTGSSDFALARYNADGSLDTSFGTGGRITTDFGAGEQANALAIQTDGRIVAAGNTGGFFAADFALARYNSNGSLDPSFGSGGKVTSDFGGSDKAQAIAIQTDGKVVVAGDNGSDFAIARYNIDGSPDVSFGTVGKVTTDFASSVDTAAALTIQTDGRIVTGGRTGSGSASNFALTRYNLNGSLDTAFGTGGKVTTDFFGGNDAVFAIARQTDGRLVAVGAAGPSYTASAETTRTTKFALTRYSSNGGLDPTFGTGGKVTTGFLLDFESATAIALQPDGKIVVVGENSPGARTDLNAPGVSSDDFRLARYNPDGSLDESFGSGGRVKTDFGFAESALAVVLQSDGKIVVVGTALTSFSPLDRSYALARYNGDGTLDASFGIGGKVLTKFGASNSFTDAANGVAVQADGKIVVAGVRAADFGLARYNVNGSLDTSFGSGGKVTTDFFGNEDAAKALLLQADGKIIAIGRAFNGAENRFALARYQPDGNLDLSFGSGGKVSEHPGVGFAAALQVDGRIVVAGSGPGPDIDFALRRYQGNGSLDTGFGSGGTTLTDFSGGDDEAFAVAVQADGKIVAGGAKGISPDKGLGLIALARYTSSGTLDGTFESGGKITTDFGGDKEGVQATAIQADGKILVAGFAFTLTQDFALARYTFPPSQLLNISTRLRVQTGENVLIGGFIVTGTDLKKVIIRGIGPSLATFFSGTLANPTLELFQGDTPIDSNDDWIEKRAEIEATRLQPTNDLEAAIVRTLAPGSYTAILRGKGNTEGIGLVEVYDLNQAANSKLANIATRGFVEKDNNVMMGGLIVGPEGGLNVKVVVRALGPSLSNFGISGALQNPTLDLVNSSGVVIRSNDNWKLLQQTEIEALGLQPSDERESALVETLGPGRYTAVVRGSGNTTGVGLVEVYNVP